MTQYQQLGLSFKLSPEAIASLQQSSSSSSSSSTRNDGSSSLRGESQGVGQHNVVAGVVVEEQELTNNDGFSHSRSSSSNGDEPSLRADFCWEGSTLEVSSKYVQNDSRSHEGHDDDEVDRVESHHGTNSNDDHHNDRYDNKSTHAHDEDGSSTSTNSDDDSMSLSLGPPSSLPLVVVNLRRLCGFTPSTVDEASQLRQQVVDALVRDDDDDNTNNDNDDGRQQQNDSDDRLARHFDDRVQELFDNGVASHSDTMRMMTPGMDDNNDNLSLAIIDYPPFLVVSCPSSDDRGNTNDNSDDGSHGRTRVITTSRQWKRLLRPHGVSVVNRLFQHLQCCNRSLSWKINMYDELLQLVKEEEILRRKKYEQLALLQWRTERRGQQLDKLYQVRETFHHKLEMTKQRREDMEQERNVSLIATRTKQQQQRQRQHVANEQSVSSSFSAEVTGGLEGMDFHTNILSFGGNDHRGNMETYHENESDEYERHGAVSSSDDGRHDATLVTQSKIVIQEAYAQEEEERVQDDCTTPQLRMAQAMVESLEQRMEQVDDLLESLQEEEWADEEEGITQQVSSSSSSSAEASATVGGGARSSSSAAAAAAGRDDESESNRFSLLDSILAMILGSLPRSNETELEEHYKVIRREHREIVREWKEYFGRLPMLMDDDIDDPGHAAVPTSAAAPSSSEHACLDRMEHLTLSSSSPPLETPSREQPIAAPATELRQALGIVDNSCVEDWDDVDDWDSLVVPLDEARTSHSNDGRKTGTPSAKATTTMPVVGLRPGGKVSH